MTIELGWFIGVCGTVFGIGMGYLNWKRSKHKDIQADAIGNGELRSDINYIKKEIEDIKTESTGSGEFRADINYIRRGIEDIRIDLKAQDKRFNDLSERVTRVEESSKQAHKRIDKLEEWYAWNSQS